MADVPVTQAEGSSVATEQAEGSSVATEQAEDITSNMNIITIPLMDSHGQMTLSRYSTDFLNKRKFSWQNILSSAIVIYLLFSHNIILYLVKSLTIQIFENALMSLNILKYITKQYIC